MANFVVYAIALVFAVVGALSAYGFVMVSFAAKGAIHEIGATVLLLCSIVSFATAVLAVLLGNIAQLLREWREL